MQRFLQLILSPATPNYSFLILRIWVGIKFIIFGWSFLDGQKVEEFSNYLTSLNIPSPLFSAYLSKGTELFGGIALVLGGATRLFSSMLFINMAVAVFVAHHGDILGEGGSAFLFLLIFLCFAIYGAGGFSLDNLLVNQYRSDLLGEKATAVPD